MSQDEDDDFEMMVHPEMEVGDPVGGHTLAVVGVQRAEFNAEREFINMRLVIKESPMPGTKGKTIEKIVSTKDSARKFFAEMLSSFKMLKGKQYKFSLKELKKSDKEGYVEYIPKEKKQKYDTVNWLTEAQYRAKVAVLAGSSGEEEGEESESESDETLNAE